MSGCLKIGLIINPIAGLGGRVALKGSDGENIQHQALALGAKPEAESRTKQALEELLDYSNQVSFYTVSGKMGSHLLDQLGFQFEVCYQPENDNHTRDTDTINAAKMMQPLVDLILFAGGDGTARNILQAVGGQQLCLGIPAGCKIYSGVFTVTPKNAGELIIRLLEGDLVDRKESQVLDINEISYRQGNIDTKVYGEMLIPQNGNYVQSVKVSGRESEELVQQEVAAWVVENMQSDTLYLIGSGSGCRVIKDELGVDGTLLGVDVILNFQCLQKDASEEQIIALMQQYNNLTIKLIITIIAGQGILLGRGNHQLCHQVIEPLSLENLMVVASKGKIKSLLGKPLAIDTGDIALNRRLTGYIPVITGYDDSILYPVGNPD